jgi:IS5 family transposase
MGIRFKKNTLKSLSGDPFLKYASGKRHFLFHLNEVIDWDAFTPRFLAAYEGEGRRGESPYHPLILFKMLLLTYLLNISERNAEELATWFIPARLFVGLGAYDAVPDHSTLTVFKRRLQKHGGAEDLKDIFDDVLRQAVAKGVRLGSVQLVDSVHTTANVNNAKDRERRSQGQESADPDATVVHKGKRQVTKANGVVEQQALMYLGYKTHVSQDADTGIVTSIKPTTGNVADNGQMSELIDHDKKMGVPGETYAADKGYDDGDLHAKLQAEGRHSAIMIRRFRTEKKDGHKQLWLDLLADPWYELGCQVRYRIERTFGEAKLWHRLGLARYRGLANFKIQSYMTFLVINLKRIVYLLTGARLRQMPAV